MKLKQLIQRIALQRKEEHPFPDNLESYLEDFIPNALLKSETLQIAFGVSGEELEGLYLEGYELYQSDHFEEASNHFRWLVMLNPYETRFWMGLGACQHLLELYEKALHSYAMAALLSADDPYPHFHAYECYNALDNQEDSQKALLLALQRTQRQDQYEELGKEIEELLKEHENIQVETWK